MKKKKKLLFASLNFIKREAHSKSRSSNNDPQEINNSETYEFWESGGTEVEGIDAK